MPTTLITGANKGLGRETARRLHAEGHEVWIGARDPGSGTEAARQIGARFVQLDVTDPDSVRAAARELTEQAGSLDVLINNAGIVDGLDVAVRDTDLEEMGTILDTNVIGPLRVSIAVWDLLEASSTPVVVNVSSSLGSLGASTTPGRVEHGYPPVAYPASKAALNMVTVKLAAALPRARVNAVTPGYTATDLNGHSGTQTVEEGAEVIVRAALMTPDGPTGAFFDAAGPAAW